MVTWHRRIHPPRCVGSPISRGLSDGGLFCFRSTFSSRACALVATAMAASHGWLASLPNQLAVASSVVNHRSAAAASFIVRASSTDASLTEKGMLGLAFR
ncbi:hypothetical protein B296_00022352 [Ensete ventricosum]|uniref:Uncharacterized protein n=1 Tax=Ensete ventricosum TaxID=4639 RepID=A0A426YQE7_ENSVE|nr:hypothetical protein B296_00022352 [Ensete ventricosum]